MNLATILISLLLIAALIVTVRRLIKDKKRGKGCSCGCEHCSGCGR